MSNNGYVETGCLASTVPHELVFRYMQAQASRRLGQSWKLSVEARAFTNVDASNPVLFSLRRDDHIQIELAHYF